MINEEYMLSVVQSMLRERESARLAPLMVTKTDVLKRVTDTALECMRRLCLEDRLGYHKTLNDVAFTLK